MNTTEEFRKNRNRDKPKNWDRLPYMNTARSNFLEKYENVQDKDLMIELVYSLHRNNQLLERNRQNTSKMVWWLIAVPLLFGLLFFFLTMLGLGSMSI